MSIPVICVQGFWLVGFIYCITLLFRMLAHCILISISCVCDFVSSRSPIALNYLDFYVDLSTSIVCACVPLYHISPNPNLQQVKCLTPHYMSDFRVLLGIYR